MRLLKHKKIFLSFLILFILQNTFSQNVDSEMEEMLRLVNELRAKEGIAPVKLNVFLNKAAFDHSMDMGKNNYFDHEGLNGSTFGQRSKAAGYLGFPRGENIAAGKSTAKATFEQWVNSPGHLNNMLGRGHNDMGIGHAVVNGSRYRHYWTQIFGKGDEVTLAVADLVIDLKTKMYPNPVKDILNIELKNITRKILDLKITSITGQIVYEQKAALNNNLTISLAHLPKGVYFLSIDSNIKRLIKE